MTLQCCKMSLIAFSKLPRSRRLLSGFTAAISSVYSPVICFPLTCAAIAHSACLRHAAYSGDLYMPPPLVVLHRRLTLGGNGSTILIINLQPFTFQNTDQNPVNVRLRYLCQIADLIGVFAKRPVCLDIIIWPQMVGVYAHLL